MYKVLIRPLNVSDASTSYIWRNDPEVWAFTGSKPDIKITEDIELNWIKKVINEKSSNRFAILVNDEYVGNVQLTHITDFDAEFHIFIGNKDFWGKGVAKEATYQILTYAKNFLGLSQVFLFVSKLNTAAIKAYAKNAFIVIEDSGEFLKMMCHLDKLPPPMVSVFCMVYNHEKFISEAIEGFLMQKINFSTLMVIGEDNSTDNSREIIKKYANLYPGKFKLLLHDKNIGAFRNQELVFENCTGKYIAMCEGDDYWTDPLKLQKQVDFLEMNNEYSLSFHSALEKINGESKEFSNVENRDYSGTEIYNNWTIPTASVVFKRKFIDNEYFINLIRNKNFVHTDIVLFIYLSQYGKIKGLTDIMSVYRRHIGGSTAQKPTLEISYKFASHYLEIYKIFGKDYNGQLKKAKDIALRGILKSMLNFNFLYFKKFSKLLVKV